MRKKLLRRLMTVFIISVMMVSMGIMVFGYNYTPTFLNNYHIISGQKSISPYSFTTEKGGESIGRVEWNTVISKGSYTFGIYQKLVNGTYGAGASGVGNISVTTSGAKNFRLQLYANDTYKPYMVGKNGVHIILTKVRMYYN